MVVGDGVNSRDTGVFPPSRRVDEMLLRQKVAHSFGHGVVRLRTRHIWIDLITVAS